MMKAARRTTGIEWTDSTWNPFLGCSIKSSGCKNCYAMALAARLESMGHSPAYRGLTERTATGKVIWSGKIAPNSERQIRKPLENGVPTVYFVNSMSDFFHENATDRLRMEAFDVIESTPFHTYQILTKRPEFVKPFLHRNGYKLPDNVWVGATVESERVADRIKVIQSVEARVRFLSIEPLIQDIGRQDLSGIAWVISGGESGIGARSLHADWVRNVRDLCIKFEVRHFFKQWGKAENNPLYSQAPAGVSGTAYVRMKDPIGKGGSLLDGKEWKEMPDNVVLSDYFGMRNF